MIEPCPNRSTCPSTAPTASASTPRVATTGPWFADAQHAGPPTALLVRALERCAPQPDTADRRGSRSRCSGPIPAGEVTVRAGGRAAGPVGRAAGRRAGRRWAGRPAGAGVAARRRRTPRPSRRARPTEPLPRSAARRGAACAPSARRGGCRASSTRWSGAGCEGWLGEPGPGTVWARQRVPLVAGEEPAPLQRLMLVADSGNGAAAPLDIREWLFVNTELTIHLHRAARRRVDGRRRARRVGPSGVGTVCGPAVRRARPDRPLGPVPHGAQPVSPFSACRRPPGRSGSPR